MLLVKSCRRQSTARARTIMLHAINIQQAARQVLAVLIAGSPAGLSRVIGDGLCSVKTGNFNPTSKVTIVKIFI